MFFSALWNEMLTTDPFVEVSQLFTSFGCWNIKAGTEWKLKVSHSDKTSQLKLLVMMNQFVDWCSVFVLPSRSEHLPLLLMFPPFMLLLPLSGHPALLLLLLPLSVPLLLRLPFLLFDQVEHHSVCVAGDCGDCGDCSNMLRSSPLSSLHLSHLKQPDIILTFLLGSTHTHLYTNIECVSTQYCVRKEIK